jgi:integrase
MDLKAGTWTIPAARMKSHREHRVPLSPRAVELLSGQYREGGNPHVFLGSRTGFGNMAMPDVQQFMERGDVTVYGSRSTFRDWAAYRNHVVEQAVEAAYPRGELFEKRRHLMNDLGCVLRAPGRR